MKGIRRFVIAFCLAIGGIQLLLHMIYSIDSLGDAAVLMMERFPIALCIAIAFFIAFFVCYGCHLRAMTKKITVEALKQVYLSKSEDVQREQFLAIEEEKQRLVLNGFACFLNQEEQDQIQQQADTIVKQQGIQKKKRVNRAIQVLFVSVLSWYSVQTYRLMDGFLHRDFAQIEDSFVDQIDLPLIYFHTNDTLSNNEWKESIQCLQRLPKKLLSKYNVIVIRNKKEFTNKDYRPYNYDLSLYTCIGNTYEEILEVALFNYCFYSFDSNFYDIYERNLEKLIKENMGREDKAFIRLGLAYAKDSDLFKQTYPDFYDYYHELFE